jgi:hypothetical protein
MSGRTFQLGELCIVIQPESLGFHIIQEIDDILVAFGEQHLLIGYPLWKSDMEFFSWENRPTIKGGLSNKPGLITGG